MKIKLAEALLRRKELAGLVETRKAIKEKDLYDLKIRYEYDEEGNLDDIVAAVPKLALSQVTQEHDFYAKQLRMIDALIQQTNWTAEIDTGEHNLMADYVVPDVIPKK